MEQAGEVGLQIPVHDLVHRLGCRRTADYFMEELTAAGAGAELGAREDLRPRMLRDFGEVLEITGFPMRHVACISRQPTQRTALGGLLRQVGSNARSRSTPVGKPRTEDEPGLAQS